MSAPPRCHHWPSGTQDYPVRWRPLRRKDIRALHALLAWQTDRGLQLLASSQSELPGLLTLGAREACVPTTSLSAAGGFAPDRWWRSLRRSLAEPVRRRELPRGMRIGPFRQRYSEATRLAINDAFWGHWRFAPISRSEWRRRGHAGEFAPGLSRLLVSGCGTRRSPYVFEAFVLTEVNRQE